MFNWDTKRNLIEGAMIRIKKIISGILILFLISTAGYCAVTEITPTIRLRELPVLKDIHVSFQFPDHILLSKDKILKIGMTVRNGSSLPVKIVVPGSNYLSMMVAYTSF